MIISEMVTRDWGCYRGEIIAVILAWSCIANAEMLQGKVVAVSDGDTVTVLDSEHNQHKIRLMGIDAPEKQHLSDLIFGRDVLVEWHKKDRFQRIVGKILVARAYCSTCDKTVDAGLEQIRAGLAWWYRKTERHRESKGGGLRN